MSFYIYFYRGEILIKLEKFSYKYEQSQKLNLDSINLAIKKGEAVLITGNSGSGKTTILRLLNGLAPNFFPGGYSGEFKVATFKIGDSISEFSKIVGSVFQNPKNQFFNLDSTSELAFSMENYGYAPEVIKERILEVADEFSASHLLNRNILELSGGEKQKLAFMATIMMDADIYILDEITSNLDLKAIELISNIIKILKEKGKTVVIAEHRIYYLKDIVDKMYVINNGKIIHCFLKEEFDDFDCSRCNIRQIKLENINLKKRQNKTLENNYLKINRLEYKVKDTSISINEQFFSTGKIYGIIGENGCGKTTFANVLSGLKKSKFNIYLNNKCLKKKDLIKSTFQVMQDVNYQLFTNNVEKEIKLGSNNLDLFDNIVDSLKLRELLNRHPNTLSGGEKQRVAIASALLSNKKILIFDEPTSGLDYTRMLDLVKLIEDCKLKDIVIFIITHDYEFLCNIVDEVLYFNKEGLKDRIELNKESQKRVYKLMN